MQELWQNLHWRNRQRF